MKKLVVAIDFSEHTNITCSYALEIAKINKAEIYLFHTFIDNIISSTSSIPDTYGVNPYLNPEFYMEIEENAKIQMFNLKKDMLLKLQAADFPELPINTILTKNDFETDLINFCEDYHPSLVIIGTKGKGRTLNIFGNTASNIINELRFPVLAVPEIEGFTGIKNIMYATDLHVSDDLLIRKTYNLLENFDVNIFSVHIVEKSEYFKAYKSMEELKLIYTKERDEGKFYCDILESNDKQDEIDEFIKSNSIDLIVFLSHKTNIFQRLFGYNNQIKYFFETNLPLLAIRL
ncbi:MAG: universal stress protein [Bacteroidales bacterium]